MNTRDLMVSLGEAYVAPITVSHYEGPVTYPRAWHVVDGDTVCVFSSYESWEDGNRVIDILHDDK